MKKQFGVTAVIVLGILAGISASLSVAQERQSVPDRAAVERQKATEAPPPSDRNARFEIEQLAQGPEGPPPPGLPGDFVFLATEMSFGGKVVKGAPYSAQAITESVQTLSDGNRIVNKSTATIYRDSEGRTRREQTFKVIGAFANGGETPQTVFISDPVAGTSYMLDPRTHTARKMPPMNFKFQFKVPGPGEAKGGATVEMPPPDRIEAGRAEGGRIEPGQVGSRRIEIESAQMRMRAGPDAFVWGWGTHVAKPESLGKEIVEGVEAEGTRSTVTIPAGEIGNDRSIEIASERWYSPELQTVVMTRHSDPRFGESTYHLTNIDRSEPARSLFEVPADYTLKSGPMVGEGGGIGIGTGAGISRNGGNVIYHGAGGNSNTVLNAQATSLPTPLYPAVARAAHASGNVTVEVTIDEDGNVVSAKAVSGHPLLQAASVEAARQAKFAPTRVSGQPAKVQGVIVYTFNLEPGAQKQTND